jgi:cardiolipin synthase (CMP-forming)
LKINGKAGKLILYSNPYLGIGGELVNIPNILTAIRFVLVPVFGYYLYSEQYLLAISLFIIGGLTDILDGYIARKFNLITSWGKLADPVADKLMQITALGLLTYQEVIPPVVLIIVIAKEVFMAIGSILLYRKEKMVVSANWYGKLATVVFFLAIIMTIVVRMSMIDSATADILVNVLVGVAVLITMFAFFMYSLAYWRIRNDEK